MKLWGPGRSATAILFLIGLVSSPAGALAIGYGAPPPDTSNTVHMLKIQGDRTSLTVQFIGDARQHVTFGSINTWWRLKTFIDTKTLAVSHHLLMDVWYNGGARGFDEAADDEGTDLTVNKVSSGRDVDNYADRFWSPIDDKYLRRHMLTGFTVTIRSLVGDSRTITVTPAQVQSQLVTEEAVVRPGFPGMKPPSNVLASAMSASARKAAFTP